MTLIAIEQHGPWTTHPVPHDDKACIMALLAEYTSERLGDCGEWTRSSWYPAYDWPAEPYVAAANAAVSTFASALARGLHGPGCIQRDEEDAADFTGDRGGIPHCASCGQEIHLFPRLDGWQHYRAAADPGKPAEIAEADHAPVLVWQHGQLTTERRDPSGGGPAYDVG